MPKVAVENNLSNIRQVLERSGFEVVAVDRGAVPPCDCCVLSGIDENMMGREDIFTKAPLINASGLNEHQVLEQVREKTGYH